MTFVQPTTPVDARAHTIGVLMVVASMLLWSTVPIATRLLVQQGGVFSAAFISVARLGIAALVFVAMRVAQARHTGEPITTAMLRSGWLWAAAGALAVNYLCYAIGLRYTTASATSVETQIHAVVTVLLAAWLLGERLTRQKIAGMILTLIGVMLVVFNGSSLHDLFASEYLLGNVIEIAGALAWPFYVIGQAKLLHEGGVRETLMPIFLAATALAAAMLPFTGPIIIAPPTWLDWGMLAFLGLGSTALAYWLFAAGLQRVGAGEGAMINVLLPATALLMAHWVLGEPLHAGVLTGLALVVAGLVLIIWRRHHAPA